MQKQQTQTEPQASSNIQNTADQDLLNKRSDSTELSQQIKIPGTPFKIVGNQENGFFLALGQYKISENKDTPEEVQDLLILDQWNIIVNVCSTIFAIDKQIDKERGGIQPEPQIEIHNIEKTTE